ncbi:MAG TPA: hypothetical protein DEB25_01785 [Desulfobulbaceae bacterium]|nr:hypothetical protein [Desulfobulbaceae bacterium]
MKIPSLVFLALVAVSFSAVQGHAGNLYDRKIIEHRARQGECTSENSEDCINVIGDKAYSYQKRGYEKTGKRDERDGIGVNRDGKLTGANIPQEIRQRTIREVHQYVDVEKKVNTGGEDVEVGAIKSDSVRKINQVRNIVDVRQKVGNVGNVAIGAVDVRNGGKVGSINNQVMVQGGVNADGRASIGGVRVGKGAAVDQVTSDVTVGGDVIADGPINIGGVRVTNGTIGGVHSTTVIKGNVNATGN